MWFGSDLGSAGGSHAQESKIGSQTTPIGPRPTWDLGPICVVWEDPFAQGGRIGLPYHPDRSETDLAGIGTDVSTLGAFLGTETQDRLASPPRSVRDRRRRFGGRNGVVWEACARGSRMASQITRIGLGPTRVVWRPGRPPSTQMS